MNQGRDTRCLCCLQTRSDIIISGFTHFVLGWLNCCSPMNTGGYSLRDGGGVWGRGPMSLTINRWPSPFPTLPWESPGQTVLGQSWSCIHRAVNSAKSLWLTAATQGNFNMAPRWKLDFRQEPLRCEDSKQNNVQHLMRGGGGCVFKECAMLHHLLSVQTRKRWRHSPRFTSL